MTMRTAALAAALALSAACAPPTMYHWGRYDERLFLHYKAPQDREAWVLGLKETILEAEQQGLKVPPGLYAEYGYALYEEGRGAEAVAYFLRERDNWPESRLFMEKMIRNADRRQGEAPVHGPAGALEKTR